MIRSMAVIKISPPTSSLQLFNTNGLLPQFLQKFLHLPILFLNLLMQISIVLFQNNFLMLQMLKVPNILINLVSLEL